MFKISFFLLLLLPLSPLSAQEDTINGFAQPQKSADFNKGLRLKGIGDFLYNKKSFAQAVPYYQQAQALLPSEADIPYRLGEIYQSEKLYRLSELYFKQSIDLFQKPENYAKTQLKAYLARVHLAEIYHAQGLKDKTLAAVGELRREEGLIKSLYTPAWERLEGSLGAAYPAEATASRPGARP